MAAEPINTNESTAQNEQLTVAHWRERFGQVAKGYTTLTTIAEVLARKDPATFGGPTGFLRVRNIGQGRGGLRITAEAVLLLEEERAPAKPPDKPKVQTLGKSKPRKNMSTP